MAYDADAVAASMEAPAVTIRGKTYTGRILSYEEFLPFQARLDAFAAGQLDEKEMMALFREYLEAVFPKKFPSWFREDTVRVILTHPGVLGIMRSFFQSQVLALAMSLGLRRAPRMRVGTT